MKKLSLVVIFNRLEEYFQKGWIFLLLLFIFAIPPFAAKGYKILKWPLVNQFIITHPVKSSFSFLYPIFKIVPVVLLVLLVIFQNRVGRWFGGYAALNYILIGIGQSVTISEQYGLAVCTSNLLLFLSVVVFWGWETISRQNDYTHLRQPFWKYWGLFLAFFAFWEPAHPTTLHPDFNPVYLLSSGAGVSFCMMTPMYLAVLSLLYPHVNLVLLQVSSSIGLLIGLGNVGLVLMQFKTYWWLGVLHIPLIVLSGYGLALAYQDQLRGLITKITPSAPKSP